MLTIAEKNEGFWELAPAARRVAVAHDVIARLDAHEIAPRRGFYAEPPLALFNEGGELAPEEEDAQCVVCAIGAAAVSVFDGEVIGRRGIEMVRRLDDEGVFTRDDLRAMERVFEQNMVRPSDLGTDFAEYGDVLYFPDEEPGSVMRRVYQNIIDHGGQFTIRPPAEEALLLWREGNPL